MHICDAKFNRAYIQTERREENDVALFIKQGESLFREREENDTSKCKRKKCMCTRRLEENKELRTAQNYNLYNRKVI